MLVIYATVRKAEPADDNVLTCVCVPPLQALLPSFGNQDAQEKIRTLQKLFRGENFKFGNPLVEFHKKLRGKRLFSCYFSGSYIFKT